MAEQRQQCAVDVVPAADATPAGDGCVGSAVPQDLQYTRLVIDIGDSKTIEITLRGKLTLQSVVGPPASAGEGEGGGGTTAAAQPGPPTTAGEHGSNVQAAEDKQFLDHMRGWLMTVATLFIGISFQAAMQPPSWITPDWFQAAYRKGRHYASAPAAPPPPPSSPAGATMTRGQGTKASLYVLCNTVTFAISLALVILLLLMKKSPPTRTMRMATLMVALLCFFVGMTFVFGNSYGPMAAGLVTAMLVLYSFGTFIWIEYMPRNPRFLRSCSRCIGSRDN